MSDAKKAILARRAKFVAAALAGIACGKDPKADPTVCLSAPMTVDAEAESPAPPPPPSAQPEAASDASVVFPEPHVCLSVRPFEPDASTPAPSATPLPAPKPKPRPCLKVAHPKDRQG